MKSPRIAFMFHSVHPSGGNLWLQRLLLHGPFPPGDCIAILPGESPLEADLAAAGIEVHRAGIIERALSEAQDISRATLLRSKWDYYRKVRALLDSTRPDIAYVNCGVQVLPGIAASRVGLPIVWHIKEGWGAGAAFRIKRRIILRCANALLFDSDAGWRLYAPIPPGKRSVVVPNGVDERLADLHERRGDLRERLGWSPEQTTVLFIGTIVQRKGVHELLEVWEELSAQFPLARLVLVGPQDPNEQHPRLARIAESLPPNTTYLGFRKDAQELLAASDLFVLPSYGEAMPISISEAMMIGCPVVARAVADVPFQIGGGRGFLFSGNGKGPLRDALRGALEDQRARGECVRRAREFALRNLTWTAHCDLIRQVVVETCAKHRDGRAGG